LLQSVDYGKVGVCGAARATIGVAVAGVVKMNSEPVRTVRRKTLFLAARTASLFIFGEAARR